MEAVFRAPNRPGKSKTLRAQLGGRHGNIVRHEITVDELRAWFGRCLKPALSDQQLETMVAKFNSGIRWPGDPLPSPGERGYCEVIEGSDDECRDLENGLKGAKALYENLSAVIAWSNIWMSDDDLKPSVAELLERILFPFGKHNPKNRSVRASKEWHSYAQILTYFIIRELVKAGHAQPSISRRSVVVRVVRQVLKLKQVPDAQMVTASAVGRFLERWDETSG